MARIPSGFIEDLLTRYYNNFGGGVESKIAEYYAQDGEMILGPNHYKGIEAIKGALWFKLGYEVGALVGDAVPAAGNELAPHVVGVLGADLGDAPIDHGLLGRERDGRRAAADEARDEIAVAVLQRGRVAL